MQNVARKYSKDGFIAALILVLPFFIYAHLIFSEYTSEFIIFNYSFNHGFKHNESFVWFFLNDMVPFSLLLMMFLTTRMKWKYFLVPLLVSYFLTLLYTLDIFSTLRESIWSVHALIWSAILVAGLVGFDHFIASKYRQMAIYANLLALVKRDYKLDIQLVKTKLRDLHSEKFEISLDHYFKKLFYLHLVLANNLRKINSSTNRSSINSMRKVDILLVLLIIFMTFIWYSYLIIPSGILEMNLVGFVIDNHGFNDLKTFIWFISRKLVVILFLSLWFITSDYWWKYAILAPLTIFFYQFWEAFQDVSNLDAISNIRVFPLVLLNVLVVAMISKWVKYRTDLLSVYSRICVEVEDLFNEIKSERSNNFEKKYKELKEESQGKDDAYYKTKLKSLEYEILKELDFQQGKSLKF